MGARSPSLTYISPAPIFLTGTPYLLSKRKARPVQLSVWQPRPSICRTVSSVPHYIYCRASNDENDVSDDVSNKTRNPWDPFRTWFKPKEAEPKKNIDHSKANCKQTDGSESSTSTTDSYDTSDEIRSNPKPEDRFRWPWQSTDASNSNPNTQKINQQREIQKERPSASNNQKSRKRVKHSDSKPGSLIDVDESSLQKNDVAWQERLKRMVDDMIPKLQKKGERSGDVSSDIPNTGNSQEVSDEERLAGVSELYKPPSQLHNDQPEIKEKGWFTPPWARNTENSDKNRHVTLKEENWGSSEKVSGANSTDSVRSHQELKEDSSGSTATDVKNSEAKGQFIPFWKKKHEGSDRSLKRGSSLGKDKKNKPESSPEIPKNILEKKSKEKVEVTFPSKKPWFQWPGTSNKEEKEGATSPTKETSDSQFPQKRTVVAPRSEYKEHEREKAATKKERTSHGEGNGKGEESETERKQKLTSTTGQDSQPPASSNRKRPSTESYSIPQRDISSIRQIFGSETFFATDTIPAPGGLLFHGNLRGEPQPTIDKLEKKLETKFGGKYTLCLAEGEDQGPVVVVVPSSYHQQSPAPRHRLMAIALAMMTVSTCLSRGLVANVLRPRIVQAHGLPPRSNILERLFYNPLSSSVTVAVCIGLCVIFAQVVQRIVASFYRTKLAIPFVLPSYQLGSFGSVVYLVSPAPNRAALFDIAIASTIAMIVPAMICFIIGLRLSTSFTSVFPVPMSLVSNSLLMGFLTEQVPNGKILVDYQRSLIGLHPLAIIGANCLTIAALNLLPIRQLDGSRIIASLFGRRAALRAWRMSVIYLLFASSKNPYLIMFLLVVSFGPWQVDRPSRNELTEPDNLRTIVGYLFMLLMIALLLPFPKSSFFGTL